MARYRLLVRAPEVGDDVESAFGGKRPMSWAEVCAAFHEAIASPGAAWRVYTVVEVTPELVVEPPWTVRAGERVGPAQLNGVPWAAPHVQESEALRSPR